jgi:hypothetical protein
MMKGMGMNKADMNSPELVRTMLVGLTIECPQGDDPKVCPLHGMRQLSFSEKFEWVKSLPDNELFNTYFLHCKCLASRDTFVQ